VICNIALLGSLEAISAITKSCSSDDLLDGNFRMNDYTPLGVNGLGGRVIGNGLSRKLSTMFSMEGMVGFKPFIKKKKTIKIANCIKYRK